MSVAMAIHLLAAIIWVGGMFFAHMILRPSTVDLEVPVRVTLWTSVLSKFLRWVWITVILLPLSGYWIIFEEWDTDLADVGLHVHLMQGLGFVMIGLFLYVFFGPFQHVRHRVEQHLFPEAGMFINRIRIAVTVNLVLGLIISIVASAGRYW